MNVLAIIPARSGSRRVPNKNIREFNGEPLIYYSIEEAKKSKHVNRLITTTDSSKIRDVAIKCGSEAPFTRPTELSGDYVTDYPVFRHCLDWLKENENYIPDIIVHLRPTAPLRTVVHIDKAVELLLQHKQCDSVRSVCEIGEHPHKAWKIEKDLLIPVIPEDTSGIKEAYNQPKQKLPKTYVQNGSVDVIRRDTIIKKETMSGKSIIPFVMDKYDSINIDEEIDFLFAEHIYKLRQGL